MFSGIHTKITALSCQNLSVFPFAYELTSNEDLNRTIICPVSKQNDHDKKSGKGYLNGKKQKSKVRMGRAVTRVCETDANVALKGKKTQ